MELAGLSQMTGLTPFAAAMAIAIGVALAGAIALWSGGAQIARLREWRTWRCALRAGPAADATELRIEAAARAVLATIASDAVRGARRRSLSPGGRESCAGELNESDWIGVVTARSARSRRRALKASGARRAPDAVSSAFQDMEAALNAGEAVRAQRAGAIVAAHLCERGFAKAAAALACICMLRLRAIEAPRDLADFHVTSLSHIGAKYGCKPAATLGALWRAHRAIEEQEFSCAREALQSVCGIGAAEARIAAADLESRLAERHGNFPRARSELRRRTVLEEGAAANARALRSANAHYLADLARIELLEIKHTTGKRMRASARAAERLLRRSATIFLGARDGGALAFVYTRLAMAAVLQHRLGAAHVWAAKGRKMAQAVRLIELSAAADDLLLRIDAERLARREDILSFAHWRFARASRAPISIPSAGRAAAVTNLERV